MRAFMFSVAVLALSACTPPASNTESGETAAAPATVAESGMRPGRWNKTITVMGRTTTEVECITTADLEQLATQPGSECTSPNGFQRTAEGLVYEAQCTREGGGGAIRMVMNGDMQNNYVADVTMSGQGMPGGMQVHVEGVYEGACRGDE